MPIIKDLLLSKSRKLITVSSAASIFDALKIMAESNIGCLIVLIYMRLILILITLLVVGCDRPERRDDSQIEANTQTDTLFESKLIKDGFPLAGFEKL